MQWYGNGRDLTEVEDIKKRWPRRRSQDGGGIGQGVTFSSTNSSKEQQNGEESLQNNF